MAIGLVVVTLVLGNYAGGELRAFPVGIMPTRSAPSHESSERNGNALLGISDSRASGFSATRDELGVGAGSAYPYNYCD